MTKQLFWKDKVIVITGGSAGLGLELAAECVRQQARVVLVARDGERVQAAQDIVGGESLGLACDVTNPSDVEALPQKVLDRFGRVDALVNCVGVSTRGAVLSTTPDEFLRLFELNFLSVVRCTRAFAEPLLLSKSPNGPPGTPTGHIVNIGSLASKSAARFIGAYPASKFPVAAYSQQLRLELGDQGLHVLLVCPGPIQRQDAGSRYDDQANDVPESAKKPGGGVKLKGIDAQYLSRRILAACQRQQLELVVPGKAKLLFAISQLTPRLGDWLLTKMTSK